MAEALSLPPGFVLENKPNTGLPPGFVLEPSAPIAPPIADAPAGTQAPVANPPPKPLGLLGSLQYGAQKTLAGLASIPTMPFDIAAGAQNLLVSGANKLLGTDIPMATPASEMLKSGAANVYEALGGNVIKDEQVPDNQRIAGKGIEFASGAILPSAALASRAPRLMAEMAGGAAKPTLLNEATRPYVGGIGNAVAKDIGASFGAGAGVEAYDTSGLREQTPESLRPLGDLAFGAMSGVGTAAGMDLTKGVGRAASGVGRYMTGGSGGQIARDIPYSSDAVPMTNREADRIGGFLQEQVRSFGGDPAAEAARIKAGANAARAAAQPLPTTGMLASPTSGLPNIERAARASAEPAFVAKDTAIARAASGTLQDMAPKLPPGPAREAANRLAEQEAAGIRGQAQAQLSQAEQAVSGARQQVDAAQQAAAAQAAPVAAMRGQQPVASERLDRALIDNALNPVTSQKNQLFDAVDPERNIKVDATPVIQKARELQASIGALTPEQRAGIPSEFLTKLEALAPNVQQQASPLLDEFGSPMSREVNLGGDGQAALGDLQEVRKYLGSTYEAAIRAGNYDLADRVSGFKGAINDLIRSRPEAADATRFYEETYRPAFAQGEGRTLRDAVQRDPNGRTVLPPSQTASRMLTRPERAEAVKNILAVSKTPQEGEKAVRDFFAAELANVVKADGTIDPITMEAWLAQRGPQGLDQFPQVKAEFTGILRDVRNNSMTRSAARDALDQATAKLRAAERGVGESERRINDSVLRLFLDNDPVNTVDAIFRSGKPAQAMSEAVTLVKRSPEATAAFQQAVVDHLTRRLTNTNTAVTGGEGLPVSMAKIGAFFRDNPETIAAMRQVFPQEKMSSLEEVHRMMSRFGNLNVRASQGSPTQPNYENAKRVTEAILKAHYGALTGGSYMRSLRIASATVFGDPAQAEKMLVQRAMLDPDVAAALLSRNVREIKPDEWSGQIVKLLNRTNALNAVSEDDNK